MDRRLLVRALACWPFAPLLAQDEEPRPRHKISARELHEALSARFPVRFGLAGVLQLEVSAPSLLLLPSRNKLGASLAAQASGPALRRVQSGELDLVFSLRYEASDQTLRAHQAEILDLRIPGLAPDALRTLREVLPDVARQATGEVILHRFSARELALPETMGFEPEKVTVVDDGVMVVFTPRQRR